MYGPNTNIVINGSIVYFSECEVRYVLGCIEMLLKGGHRALDVRKDVHDAFNERVDAENKRMAWGWADVHSWYKNEHGRSSANSPSAAAMADTARRASATNSARAGISSSTASPAIGFGAFPYVWPLTAEATESWIVDRWGYPPQRP